MKKFIAIALFGCVSVFLSAQDQAKEFNGKIRAESVKNTADELNVEEKEAQKQRQNEENPSDNSENSEIDQKLIVSKINFIGLKKTRESYIQPKFKKFTGKTVAETDMHDFETAVQLEGLFDDIHINLEQISETEAQINVSVKEKITFIPLPFAMGSNSGFMAGGIVMDTNAFGRKDMFMIGGFFSSDSMTAMASVSRPPKENWIPGFSIFVSGSKSTPELENLDEDPVFKYRAKAFSAGFSISEKIGDHFSVSNGYSFKLCSTDDHEDYLKDSAPESIRIGSTSLSFGYSKSDWNGFFMSTNSASISAEIGLTNSEDSDFRYPQEYSFSIGEQHPIFTPRLRMYQKISGSYGRKNHLSQFKDKGAGSVSILPGYFKTERIIGGNAGFEVAVKKFSWALLSIYGDYQVVYTQDFPPPDDEKSDYKFMHGPNGGIRFYLAKVAFPALAMGLAYNVTQHYWQFAAALGMSL